MKLALDRSWDGRPARDGIGGDASVALEGDRLTFRWDVRTAIAYADAPNAPVGFVDGLWRHDVVELFLTSSPPGSAPPRSAPPGSTPSSSTPSSSTPSSSTPSSPVPGAPAYVELEVGPGGHWLALAFRGVRSRDAELRALEPTITQERAAHAWRGAIEIDAAALAPWLDPGGSLRGIACLVVRDTCGQRAFLCSARLPGDVADFHQPGEWPALIRP